MSKEKETKKLEAEELEKRAAPLALYNVDTESTGDSGTSEPTAPDGGTDSRGEADRTGVVQRTQ